MRSCGCGHMEGFWSHLPVWQPASSRSAPVWSGHSRPCCPSAGSPPGGATGRSSAERAPSCSEPETMATAQRHHLHVSSGRMRTICSLIVAADTHFFFICMHPRLNHTHSQTKQVLIWGDSGAGWASGSARIMQIKTDHADNQTQYSHLKFWWMKKKINKKSLHRCNALLSC